VDLDPIASAMEYPDEKSLPGNMPFTELTYREQAQEEWDRAIKEAEGSQDARGVKDLTWWRSKPFARLHGNLIYDATTKKTGIILGSGGSGKTNLTAMLRHKGFTVRSDDEVYLYLDGNRLLGLGDVVARYINVMLGPQEGDLFMSEPSKSLVPIDFIIYLDVDSDHNGPDTKKTEQYYQFLTQHVWHTVVQAEQYAAALFKIPHLAFGHEEQWAMERIDFTRLEQEAQTIKKWLKTVGSPNPTMKKRRPK
jgi:hypothetical protein